MHISRHKLSNCAPQCAQVAPRSDGFWSSKQPVLASRSRMTSPASYLGPPSARLSYWERRSRTYGGRLIAHCSAMAHVPETHSVTAKSPRRPSYDFEEWCRLEFKSCLKLPGSNMNANGLSPFPYGEVSFDMLYWNNIFEGTDGLALTRPWARESADTTPEISSGDCFEVVFSINLSIRDDSFGNSPLLWYKLRSKTSSFLLFFY